MIRLLAVLATAALLAACQQPPIVVAPTTGSAPALASAPAPTSSLSSLQQLATFTETDLAAADLDAVANNDVVAHACYPALIQFIKALPNPGGTVSGAFSAFQKVRDLGNTAQAGIPTYLKMGCAPLVVDTETLLAKLAAIGGGLAGAAMTGGASLALPIPIP